MSKSQWDGVSRDEQMENIKDRRKPVKPGA